MSKIYFNDNFAYLSGVKAAVTIGDSSIIFEKPDGEPKLYGPIGKKQYGKIIPWGEDNNLPEKIIEKAEKSELVSSNLLFNTLITYGMGIEYGKIGRDEKGDKIITPMQDDRIDEFFERNDIAGGYLLRQLIDINTFFQTYSEIIFNTEEAGKREVVSLQSKQTIFSRIEQMDPHTGTSKHHFYSALWGDGEKEENIIATPMLNPNDTIRDALIRTGILENEIGKKVDLRDPRYIISLDIPTAGRLYYPKPPWWSIFESGWYDYAISIPQFKKNLMVNQSTIKYHIQLAADYFEDIFKKEGITEDNKKTTRMKLEFENFNKFLSDPKNTGKSMISYIKYTHEGKELPKVKITTIDNPKLGGEYIEDSEEASNLICYAMGVHPSLIGAAPGKNKSISGTEARELFTIKQALVKPYRDRIVKPLYVVKALNNWPKEIGFYIPNMVLTTLDKGTGSKKVIS